MGFDQNMVPVVDLTQTRNPPLSGNRNIVWQITWYILSVLVFDSPIHLPYSWKAGLLRVFGARIGQRVVIKPRVRIKYPWYLDVGDSCWFGEGLWIDNLALVTIKSNVCISQGVMLITGNHNYKSPYMDRFVAPIYIDHYAWVGAKCIICPGTEIEAGTVISVGSVLSGRANAWSIYRGNPAVSVGSRVLEEKYKSLEQQL